MCVGVLYDRHKTRLLRYYAGMARTMPIFAVLLVFFTMANISLPGTSSFVGEFLVFAGIFQSSTWAASVAATGMVLGAGYGLWLCNRVLYGVPKPHFISTTADVNRREFWCFVPLIVVVVWMGIYPESYLSVMHTSVANILSHGM
jgi:NADH:ubiquinone oxidoreductase subunit 4 (subunit M)